MTTTSSPMRRASSTSSTLETPQSQVITSVTPANDTNAPMSLTALGVSAPIAIASSAVITGVVAMSSAESPAGIVWRATGHRIW